MNLVLRVILAIVVGLLVAGVLDYFNVLTPHLNALLGFLAALVTFFGWDGNLPGRTV